MFTQVFLALVSKYQGMDALQHSPPTLKRLAATLQMAQIDTQIDTILVKY